MWCVSARGAGLGCAAARATCVTRIGLDRGHVLPQVGSEVARFHP